jgi:DNA-binding protein H-NS
MDSVSKDVSALKNQHVGEFSGDQAVKRLNSSLLNRTCSQIHSMLGGPPYLSEAQAKVVLKAALTKNGGGKTYFHSELSNDSKEIRDSVKLAKAILKCEVPNPTFINRTNAQKQATAYLAMLDDEREKNLSKDLLAANLTSYDVYEHKKAKESKQNNVSDLGIPSKKTSEQPNARIDLVGQVVKAQNQFDMATDNKRSSPDISGVLKGQKASQSNDGDDFLAALAAGPQKKKESTLKNISTPTKLTPSPLSVTEGVKIAKEFSNDFIKNIDTDEFDKIAKNYENLHSREQRLVLKNLIFELKNSDISSETKEKILDKLMDNSKTPGQQLQNFCERAQNEENVNFIRNYRNLKKEKGITPQELRDSAPDLNIQRSDHIAVYNKKNATDDELKAVFDSAYPHIHDDLFVRDIGSQLAENSSRMDDPQYDKKK